MHLVLFSPLKTSDKKLIAYEKAISKLYFEGIGKYYFWMIPFPLQLPNPVQPEAWTLSAPQAFRCV